MLKSQVDNINIIGVGGVLREASYTFVGPETEKFFDNYFANKYFISAVGLHQINGLTDPQMIDTQVKKAALNSSQTHIALIDSSKFGVRSAVNVCRLNQIDILVTDSGVHRENVDALVEQGVDVHIAPTSSN